MREHGWRSNPVRCGDRGGRESNGAWRARAASPFPWSDFALSRLVLGLSTPKVKQSPRPARRTAKSFFSWFPTAKCAQKEPRRYNEHDGKSRFLVVVPVVPSWFNSLVAQRAWRLKSGLCSSPARPAGASSASPGRVSCRPAGPREVFAWGWSGSSASQVSHGRGALALSTSFAC